jgi:hypothetical protein
VTRARQQESSRGAEFGKLCEPIPLASQAMLRCLEPNISKHCAATRSRLRLIRRAADVADIVALRLFPEAADSQYLKHRTDGRMLIPPG